MKVLIVGTGVIGTIYGWALHEAGVDVTHYVRKGKILSEEATIDILDERKDHPKYQKTVYPWKTAEAIGGRYDLVIVPTNWYQTGEALKEIAPLCPRSFFYILTSNWTGTDIFDGILARSRYMLGYPDGGGTIREGMYWANIGPEIHIAAPSDGNKDVFEMIGKAFGKAGIKLDVGGEYAPLALGPQCGFGGYLGGIVQVRGYIQVSGRQEAIEGILPGDAGVPYALRKEGRVFQEVSGDRCV